MKYQKKPEVVEAVQWKKNGDHPSVKMMPGSVSTGWITTATGGNAVHEGDYIVLDAAGRLSSVKPQVFEALYMQAE